MTQQTINIGNQPGDGTGDPARTAFTKVNQNFTEVYANATPGGSVGQIQYKLAGTSFGGFTASGDATINTTTGVVTVSAPASRITNTPSGTIAATDVQSAINEIVSDLAASSGSSLVGFLQSGTGAQARTEQAKLRDVVSVKDFGAVGDGTTNDATAIQNALNSGFAVYFPRATYAVGAALTAGSGTVIIGNGATLKRTFDTNFLRTLTTSGSNVIIRDLIIDGNRSALTLTEFKGSFSIGSSNTLIDGCIVKNSVGDGIGITSDAAYVTVSNCIFDNSYRNGGSVTSASKVTFLNCQFINTNGTAPQAGLDIEPDTASDNCYEISVIGCRFETNTTSGAQVLLSTTPTGIQRDVHFDSCEFYNSGIGLNLNQCYSTRVMNCDVRNNVNGGIYFSNNASDVQIIGGMVRSNGQRGISVVVSTGVTAKDIVISGVAIKDNGATSPGTVAGIRADASGTGSVVGLTIVGCKIGNDGTSNQNYGLTTGSFASKVKLIGNDFNGNSAGAVILGDDQTTRVVEANLGMVNKGGSFTCGAGVATHTVSNNQVGASSRIVLTPTNAAAATMQGSAKCVYVSAKTAGTSFAITTANAATFAGTETFDYYILSGIQ
jgi:hypothetical protein